jgi:hypothetical protein
VSTLPDITATAWTRVPAERVGSEKVGGTTRATDEAWSLGWITSCPPLTGGGLVAVPESVVAVPVLVPTVAVPLEEALTTTPSISTDRAPPSTDVDTAGAEDDVEVEG